MKIVMLTLANLVIFLLSGVSNSIDLPSPVPCQGCWIPPIVTSWQIQFTGRLNTSFDVDMYEIDMFDNDAATVTRLHDDGRKVICYINAGAWEDWRPDKDLFPPEVLGNNYSGWSGERWLDIRRIDLLGPIMESRLNQCKAKGFDGIEFDNIDGYQNETGFSLTYDDQLLYNVFLANKSHEHGLNVAFKNNPDQVQDLVIYFDWALSEACYYYKECEKFLPFIQAGKAVMVIEYQGIPKRFCPELNALNFNGMKKRRKLDAWRMPCR